jgi:hypothetical protein
MTAFSLMLIIALNLLVSFYSVTQLSYFIVSYLHKVSIKSPFIKNISFVGFFDSLTKARLVWIFSTKSSEAKSIRTSVYLASKSLLLLCLLFEDLNYFCTIRKRYFNSFFVDVFNCNRIHFESSIVTNQSFIFLSF